MNLARAFATVGGSTLLSRILGFVRDILLAAGFGTGPIADAFFVAFRLPNLFRRWFAEGAFNSAFVPLFGRRLEEEGKDAAHSFAEEAMAALGFTVLVFSILVIAGMPLVMVVFAPGFVDNKEQFDLAVLLTQITFPYLFCMAIIALLSGLLNATGRFAAAAFAPVLLNVVLIGALVFIGLSGLNDTPNGATWLAGGVAFAGLAQLALLYVSASRAGYRLRIRRPRLTPGVRRLIALGIPGIIAGGVTQINIFIGTIIATLQDGAVSFLYLADRVYQLPLGVIGIALGVVLLPDLTRRLRSEGDASANASQNKALEYAMLLTLPAAAALATIAEPVVSVLFERGAFTAESRVATAAALQAFAFGLPAFVLIKVFSPGYFAREDTKTPMIFAAIGVAINIAGSLALFPFIGHVGIAIATSLSAWVNAALLAGLLLRRGHWVPDGAGIKRTVLMIASSAAMAGVLYGIASIVGPQLDPTTPDVLRLPIFAGLIAAGILVFFLVAHLTGAARLSQIAGQFLRRSA
ncbi:MAG: murein biosynthesis integral membrane protein MurJ [Pseudomonadota bacterium]